MEQTGTWAAYSYTAAVPKFQLDYQSFDSLYRQICLKSIPLLGKSCFAGYMALHLADVAAKLDENDLGWLHLEIGALTLATRDAIAKRDWHNVCRYFTFVADVLEDAAPDLRDAISVSYLEPLLYGENAINYAKARTLLPKPLSRELEKVENHYEKIAAELA